MKEQEAQVPKPRILVDCDGVLADFNGAVCRHFKRPVSSVNAWDFAKAWDFDPGYFWGIEMEFSRQPGFCASLGVLCDVAQCIKDLREFGEVLIVTSPLKNSAYWCGERIEWLKQFGIKEDEIIFTSRKELLRADVLIDDGPHNLEACKGLMTTIKIDCFYNKDAHCDFVAADLPEAVQLLRGAYT